jgi:hypothetical protein
MPHTNRPIRDNDTLRPSIDSTFAVTVYTEKATATKISDEEASRYRETRYTVKIDDGFISVNHSAYFALFGDLPGDDVVYRAEP